MSIFRLIYKPFVFSDGIYKQLSGVVEQCKRAFKETSSTKCKRIAIISKESYPLMLLILSRIQDIFTQIFCFRYTGLGNCSS